MDNKLLDLVSALSDAKDAETIWQHTSNLLNQLGFETVNYGIIDTKTSEAIGFYSTMSTDWMNHYISNRYDLNDPWIDHLLKSNHPVFHSQSGISDFNGSTDSTSRKLLAECSEAGLTSSVMIPFHSPLSSTSSGINIGSAVKGDEFQERFSNHRTIVTVAATLLNSFLSGPPEHLKRAFANKQNGSGQSTWYPIGTDADNPVLSAREREVLHWLSAGERTDRIAEKMGVAPVTVNFHLTTIKRKLGAKTREQALVTAIRLGEIEP